MFGKDLFRLLFFRHIPLFTFLFLILVMDFHTWWRCHPISVSQAQLSSHNSVISCLWITDRWLLSCASETKIRWQRHQVWKFTNNICKSKILLKKCSLLIYGWHTLVYEVLDYIVHPTFTGSFYSSRKHIDGVTWEKLNFFEKINGTPILKAHASCMKTAFFWKRYDKHLFMLYGC